MTDIVEFLRARYAEERAAAQPAAGIWPEPWQKQRAPGGWRVGSGQRLVIMGHPAATEYIASRDARQALADIDAKLQILKLHEQCADEPECWVCGDQPWCRTTSLLALPYAGHADYDQEWTP